MFLLAVEKVLTTYKVASESAFTWLSPCDPVTSLLWKKKRGRKKK